MLIFLLQKRGRNIGINTIGLHHFPLTLLSFWYFFLLFFRPSARTFQSVMLSFFRFSGEQSVRIHLLLCALWGSESESAAIEDGLLGFRFPGISPWLTFFPVAGITGVDGIEVAAANLIVEAVIESVTDVISAFRHWIDCFPVLLAISPSFPFLLSCCSNNRWWSHYRCYCLSTRSRFRYYRIGCTWIWL